MAEPQPNPLIDLYEVALRVRRDPAWAREVAVLSLAQGVTARWRETEDMLQVSEDVPVAAWIVRKKVEGLIRPDEPEPESEPYDRAARPQWLQEAVERLSQRKQAAQSYLSRPSVTFISRAPAAVKEPSLWKLSWSYPTLKVKPTPPVRVVERGSTPLQDRIAALWQQLQETPRLSLQEHTREKGREEGVVTFLATVHLWHQCRVTVEQETTFGEIWIERAMGGTSDASTER